MVQEIAAGMSDKSVFTELIQRNPDICSNCFRRRFVRFEKNYYVGQDSGDIYVTEIRDSIRPIVSDERHGVSVVSAPSDRVTRGMTTACQCGVYFHGATVRPQDADTILDMTKRLRDRLDEEHVDFDTDVLFSRVRDCITDPDMQGRQDEMFDQAVHDAIESCQ